MKTVHQLFNEFKQLTKPSDRDYMRLGHDLAKSIVITPKNQHDLLWKFVRDKFPPYKSELIMYGATFYSELDLLPEPIPEESNKIRIDFTKIEIPKEEESSKATTIVENVEKLDSHEEKIAKKVNEIRASIEKLDNNISVLKAIENPGFSMKMAIDALEKFRVQMNEKHNKPKPK
jgi:hypothetical protein